MKKKRTEIYRNVKISPEIHHELVEYAIIHGMKIFGVVEIALKEYFTRRLHEQIKGK
jgi:hypothetical protein